MKRIKRVRKETHTKSAQGTQDTQDTATELRKQIRNRKKVQKQKESEGNFLWVPSGSVMFNLGCSDRWYGAYKTGTMINIIGDSSAGKSILVLSGLAATANNPLFNDYRLINDDAEFANSFNMRKLFGKTLADRIEGPDKDPEKNSTTIEEFYDYIFDAFEEGHPFIYVLDSFDALDADAEFKKEQENRTHRKKGNLSKVKGSFQATKQKKASMFFRHICSELKKTQSVLIIISQTRDNLSALSFETKYRAGGKALKFYASIEAWLAYKGAIKRTIHNTQHRVGVHTGAKITKNKYTGKYKTPEFPIYYDYGIDDISSCLDFLVSNGFYEKKKSTIIIDSIGIQGTKEKLIREIENNDQSTRIFEDAQECWNNIESQLCLGRKSKYE